MFVLDAVSLTRNSADVHHLNGLWAVNSIQICTRGSQRIPHLVLGPKRYPQESVFPTFWAKFG